MKKGFSINRVLSTMKKRPAFGNSNDEPTPTPDPNGDSPEAVAGRAVRQFCESGGSSSDPSQGDDITFLPAIVDAAESSPAAAAECARVIRKFLNRDYWSKPSFQYNAIMLIRILSDNPGQTFTRNLDKKFVDASKELLRSGRDPHVRQMLMETLDSFENTKGYDEGLGLIIEMWKKEKEKAYKAYGGRPTEPNPRVLNAPPFNPQPDPHSQEYFSRTHRSRRLPSAIELANRLEEARTSAKLLEQVVGCTPPAEVLHNDLIKEFADRCLSASRSIQGYMTADDPSPDNDTMESLIDTNEQLQHALNQHQRAVLHAKKQLPTSTERSSTSSPATQHAGGDQSRGGWGIPPPSGSPPSQQGSVPGPPVPSRKPVGASGGSGSGSGAPVYKGKGTDPWDTVGPTRSGAGTPAVDDPFRDPVPRTESAASSSRRPGRTSNDGGDLPRLPYEPFHPGFNPSTHGKDRAAAEPVTPVSDDGLYDNENDAYRATPPKPPGNVYRY
ncbi:hypothetical protein B0T25DRAFT_63789 [Lasiosphaeria hispida]|uniref:GAT domain-containing protein n=1 Tax=Lasiosphaeria hispida TaxID=260671 RepID=A0AAJ0HWY3_9PEZI|nr:hypothetical protein B0T25DRAFT_63789 [Lasiosphaeria hispida]